MVYYRDFTGQQLLNTVTLQANFAKSSKSFPEQLNYLYFFMSFLR